MDVDCGAGDEHGRVTQRFGINIRAKQSEILDIGRGVSDFRVEDVQLRDRP